jgi:hypothetical protein
MRHIPAGVCSRTVWGFVLQMYDSSPVRRNGTADPISLLCHLGWIPVISRFISFVAIRERSGVIRLSLLTHFFGRNIKKNSGEASADFCG